MEQNHKPQEEKHIENVYPSDLLEDYAEKTRNLIEQENTRLNERTTYLLQLQGLLFAALAFAWGKETFVIVVLGLVGIFSSFAIANGLRWAVKAIDDLEEEWAKKGKAYSGPRIIGIGKNIGIKKEKVGFLEAIFYPPYMLPVIFIVAWVSVLLFQLFR